MSIDDDLAERGFPSQARVAFREWPWSDSGAEEASDGLAVDRYSAAQQDGSGKIEVHVVPDRLAARKQGLAPWADPMASQAWTRNRCLSEVVDALRTLAHERGLVVDGGILGLAIDTVEKLRR